MLVAAVMGRGVLLLRDDRIGGRGARALGEHELRGLSRASAACSPRTGSCPDSFAIRGRRLVYSQGIIVLAVLSGALLVVFGGITDRLIPLFAIGALLAFTMSQAGMVAHWRREGGRQARHSLPINLVGAVATGVTVVVVADRQVLRGRVDRRRRSCRSW